MIEQEVWGPCVLGPSASASEVSLPLPMNCGTLGSQVLTVWSLPSAPDWIRAKFPVTCRLYLFIWKSVSVIGAIRAAKQRNSLLRTNVWNRVSANGISHSWYKKILWVKSCRRNATHEYLKLGWEQLHPLTGPCSSARHCFSEEWSKVNIFT